MREVDDGCQDAGCTGLPHLNSGFLKSLALDTFSDLHNIFLCLFLLTGGCRTSLSCCVNIILIQSSLLSPLV